ncbi:hypothetical protein HUG17_6660 [Dermatophagoides farinae]|uniref:Uncharacterized protein n=1 Tax=Dermatophagoides farinae TaxID=6954 RepID=A0A9D4P560_DERFA|nr:hypothetical protein HUG17_6660 [Dermatophagoides farinae]
MATIDNSTWIGHIKSYLSQSQFYIVNRSSNIRTCDGNDAIISENDDSKNSIVDENNVNKINGILDKINDEMKINNSDIKMNDEIPIAECNGSMPIESDQKKSIEPVIPLATDSADNLMVTNNTLETINEQSIPTMAIGSDDAKNFDDIDNNGYKFHILPKNDQKPVTIIVSDKEVGIKIDHFLHQFGFEDYMMIAKDKQIITDQSGDNSPQSEAIIRYDRDFLIQLQTNNSEDYLDNLLKSPFTENLFGSHLNLFRFHH